MPSATEAEANGIELGEMNRLLLEKVEQMMLYILKQENDIQLQASKILNQEQKINLLEKEINLLVKSNK